MVLRLAVDTAEIALIRDDEDMQRRATAEILLHLAQLVGHAVRIDLHGFQHEIRTVQPLVQRLRPIEVLPQEALELLRR